MGTPGRSSRASVPADGSTRWTATRRRSRTRARTLGGDARFRIDQASFAQLENFAERHAICGRVDGLLLDLGVSSPQLDDAGRGFSFQADGPLDMRMDPAAGESAADWLARAPADEIAQVLRDYGEERHAGRIARAIVATRGVAPLRSTRALAKLVARASPTSDSHKHPATRTFQGIRIYINEELDALTRCLAQSLRVLAGGARLAVISFHSLEDRIVKRFIREESVGAQLPRGVPVTGGPAPGRLRAIGKAQRATESEVARNPRARSAVLRVAERLA